MEQWLKSAWKITAIVCTSFILGCQHQESATPVGLNLEPTTVYISNVEEVPSIEWHPIGPEILELAEERPIFALLTLEGCERCDILEETTLLDPQVVEKVNKEFIPIKLNLEDNLNIACYVRLRIVPGIVLLAKPKDIRVVIQGVVPPNELIKYMDAMWDQEEIDSDDMYDFEKTFAGLLND